MDNKITNEKKEEIYDPKTGNLISKYCQNPACPKFYDKAENEKDKFCPYCGTKYPIVVNSSNDVKTPWWNKILNPPVVFSFIIAIISFFICFKFNDIIINVILAHLAFSFSFIVAIVVYFICHHYLINKQKKSNKKL